jgi:hypothetical protein
MNLLGKQVSIRKFLTPGLIILISVFYGCETSEDPGIEFPLDSNLKVKFKEFLLPASNVYIDSLRTDGQKKILVGNYTDPLSGTIKAEGYMTLSYILGSLPGNQILKDVEKADGVMAVKGDVYDSVRISIASSKSLISGDSTQSFQFNELTIPLESNLVYLASLKKETARQIGSHQFSVSNSSDTTYINSLLINEFGIDLFEKGLELGTLATPDWPSIGISAGLESNVLSTILMNSDTSRIYLYLRRTFIDKITDGDTIYKDTTVRADFTFSVNNFTHLDRSESQFNGIPEKTDFDFPDGRTMIDPLYGISTSFNVDELADFFEENQNILLNDVTIAYDYDLEGETDTIGQISNFMAYIRKEDKGFFGPAYKTTNASFSNIIMSDNAYLGKSTNPAFAHFGSGKIKILMNSTLFFQSVYQDYREFQLLQFTALQEIVKPISEFVLISPTDVTLNRTIFKKDGIKLRVYYTEVDE